MKNAIKQQLQSGEIIRFSNAEFQESIGSDDIREAHLKQCKNHSFANEFQIEFNGAIIYSSKTFESFWKRFETLKDKWSLTLEIIEA